MAPSSRLVGHGRSVPAGAFSARRRPRRSRRNAGSATGCQPTAAGDGRNSAAEIDVQYVSTRDFDATPGDVHAPTGPHRPRPLSARRPAGRRAGSRRHPLYEVRARQRPAADRARGPQGADRRRQRLVRRRRRRRGARQDRLRPPVRAPDVQWERALQRRLLQAVRPCRGHRHERHHQPGPHQLLPGGADHRPRHGAVDGVGPHGAHARRRRSGPARRATRRRAEREAAGREPAPTARCS